MSAEEQKIEPGCAPPIQPFPASPRTEHDMCLPHIFRVPGTASVLLLLVLLLLNVAPLSARPGLKTDEAGDGSFEKPNVLMADGVPSEAVAEAPSNADPATAPAPAVPPAVLAPLAKTWVSSSGHRFSLGEAFEAVFEADYEGGKVAVSLGGKVRCGALYNPRSVAACSYDAAAANKPTLLALKGSGLIGLAVPARPDAGARVVLQSSEEDSNGSPPATATIDFVCDPGMQRAKGVWTVVGTRKPGGQYFVSVKSAYGCPVRIVALTSPGGTAAAAGRIAGGKTGAANAAPGVGAANQAAADQKQQRPHARRRTLPANPIVNLPGGIIEWIGSKGYGWRYELKELADAVFEFDAPHDVGFLEASIGGAVHCGDDSDPPDDVLSCLYPDGVAPIVAGLKSSMTIWRASERGVELKFKQQGSCSGIGTDRATWIRLVCDRSVQEWVAEPVYPYEREECLFIVEVRSALACPTLLGQRSPGKPAVVFAKKNAPTRGAEGPAGKDAGADGAGQESAGQGCIRGDCKNGVGTWRWPSGTAYSGDWLDGQRGGKGNQVWYDGRKYSGGWRNGNRHGKGSHTYARGDRYEGDWVEDAKEGEGTYFWPDGSFYVGHFKADQLSGMGTKQWPQHSTRYEGMWAYGQQNGYGSLTYRDGDAWTGEWKDGQKTADGKLRCTKVQFKFQDHCHRECPQGSYPSQRRCVLCDKGCLSCTGIIDQHHSYRISAENHSKFSHEFGSGACTECLPKHTLKRGMCEGTVIHDDL